MIGLKNKKKRELFGGALRGAGLAAMALSASASADFVAVDGGSYTNVFAYDNYAGFTQVYDVPATGFAAPSNITAPGLELNAYTGSTLMGASASMSIPAAWDYVGARVLQYFTVDSSKEMLVEWDFGDFNSATYSSYAFVYQVGVGALLTQNAYSAPGSASLTLLPGELYLFRGNLGGFGGGDGFVRASNVPGAGVLPLLGMALVTGRRRRRRE